ncbi:hypothetical protein NITLEN_80096 [Nitrospira lenta]|uniref:Uncharacterized protein n=1 Tax=Nitrospira lenta TaxID=1436998 RepID=A0A330LBH7_9BACT|nr:hypothetical protein NITLEN_80096 [Nitrospira lenta]
MLPRVAKAVPRQEPRVFQSLRIGLASLTKRWKESQGAGKQCAATAHAIIALVPEPPGLRVIEGKLSTASYTYVAPFPCPSITRNRRSKSSWIYCARSATARVDSND